MVIGRPEWFARRKYGGWGIFPKTWQGWLYLAVIIALLAIVQIIPGLTENQRLISLIVIAAIFALDTLHIMFTMKNDERDRIHEAIAERNALWAMIFVLAVGVAYQAARGVVQGSFEVDPVILIALGAAVLVKAISNIYLDRRN